NRGVDKDSAVAELSEVVRRSALVEPGPDGVVMVSGAPASACLAAGLTPFVGPSTLHALHVNYGLRETADRDERACRDLCARLRIALHIERPSREELGEGNMQAAARELRYAAAERLRARAGAVWIATGHTRSALAETVLYRLAASPGSRALLGLPSRSGRVVRPIMALSRQATRELATRAELPFADDPTNEQLSFARNRVRAEALPALTLINEQAERNIAETQAEL